MQTKSIAMIAGPRAFCLAGERVEPGSTIEVSPADAFVLASMQRADFVNPRDAVYALDSAGAPARDRSDRPMYGPGPAGMPPSLPMPGVPLRI